MIVTNADGKDPGIYFFNYELEQIRYFELPEQEEAPYNMELFIDSQLGFL